MDRDVQGGTARQRDVPAIYRKRQKQKIFVVHYNFIDLPSPVKTRSQGERKKEKG